MKKFLAKLFKLKLCKCNSKPTCDHSNTAIRKEVKYCSSCKTILNEG